MFFGGNGVKSDNESRRQNLRIPATASKYLFIICLPLLLLTASIGWGVNSLWLYEYGFAKYNVSQSTGLSEAELEKVATGLISYFRSGEEYINLTVEKDGEPFELFTREEAIHFKDVKRLVRLDYWVLLGTLIYVLVYTGVSLFRGNKKYRRQLARGTVWGSGITLVLMLALGLGTLLGFDELFLRFHLLFFSNEYWSAEGYMLMLFPRDFWYDAVIFCGSGIAGTAVALGGAAGGYLLFQKKRRSLSTEEEANAAPT
jgi:integral membrane protein (TIGR01906 family)